MPIDYTTRIAALNEETERIERESESVYLAMGRLFPELASEMNKSTGIAERSLLRFSESLGSGASASGFVAIEKFMEEAGNYFRELHDRDTHFLARINESIDRLGNLDEVISRVRLDSEEMEIISLNAMTVALKSGAEGKAFSVITDELKRLSGKTIALTEEVTGRGRSLLESFAKLRNSLGDLDSWQNGFFGSLEKNLRGSYESIESGLEGSKVFFGDLISGARGIREPVLRVMEEVQLQDIVRQSLQHVSISLREARDPGETRASPAIGWASPPASEEGEDHLAFVAAVASLCEDLIDDVTTKLDASERSFHADMDAIRELVDGSENRRSEYLLRAKSALRKVEIGHFEEDSKRYLALKRTVIATARRLADQVKELDQSFKGLAGLLSRFQTIVIASRIEVAKTRALSGVMTTVQGMIDLTDRLEGDVGSAVGTTKQFIKGANSAIADYSSGEDAEKERLTATLSKIEKDIKSLDGIRDSVHGAIDDFKLYTPEFIVLIRKAGDELETLSSLSARLKSVMADLGAFKDTLRERLPPGMHEVRSDRLRKMVDRFTIFTHKKAAGEIGRFDVEEGSGAGEVTLF